jgi:3-hydroxyethyl bacteriochlorophyllide a dehydrogenase
MMSWAVVLEGAERIALRHLALTPRTAGQVVVDIEWTAISTGTERLLFRGEMPPFPGMGYPLVPGYESVGRVVEADASSDLKVGDRVFVPGANCFGEVRGLFGGAASRLVVPAERAVRIDAPGATKTLAEKGVLLALAATAYHALVSGDGRPAELIIGHGVLGRLLARLAVLLAGPAGTPVVVWEKNPARTSGAVGYQVLDPQDDPRKDYRSIYDVSGDATLVDSLLGRLARGGELVLAGFYERIDFGFPLAFMKEARLRVAAEFQPSDLAAVVERGASGALDLDGLITHRSAFSSAAEAYATAFSDPGCLKMLIDWRTSQ